MSGLGTDIGTSPKEVSGRKARLEKKPTYVLWRCNWYTVSHKVKLTCSKWGSLLILTRKKFKLFCVTVATSWRELLRVFGCNFVSASDFVVMRPSGGTGPTNIEWSVQPFKLFLDRAGSE